MSINIIQDDNLVPNNIEAEKSVLGSCLNNNDNVMKIADFLQPDHFFVGIHKKIYESILKFIERGMIATPITIKNHFMRDDSEDDYFGYLVQLTIKAQLVIDIESLAKVIVDAYLRRQIIDVCKETIMSAYDYSDIEKTAYSCLEESEQKLFNLANDGRYGSNFCSLKDGVIETIRKIELSKRKNNRISGVSTGFYDMDRLMGGMQNSDLIIVAARPSMGKTSLAINIALNAVMDFQINNDEKSAAMFSLEMSSEQIATRILSMRTGVDSGRIRTGNVTKEEFATLSSESAVISNMPLFIDDTAALSISAIRTRARRLKRQRNVGIIVIDYLQLIRSTLNFQNRTQEVGDVSQGLKALAKELDLPVVALSQLSRAVESRENKRPQLSDLRESGNIEQDADVVAFLYREEYYLNRSVPTDDNNVEWQKSVDSVKNIAEIIISKQRNGPIGTFFLHFNENTTCFSNYTGLK